MTFKELASRLIAPRCPHCYGLLKGDACPSCMVAFDFKELPTLLDLLEAHLGKAKNEPDNDK